MLPYIRNIRNILKIKKNTFRNVDLIKNEKCCLTCSAVIVNENNYWKQIFKIVFGNQTTLK